MLAALVEAGELPPVEERLPINPAVVEPIDSIGVYGGTWHHAWRGVNDFHAFGRIFYDPAQPAHLYIVNTPAHTTYPTTHIPINLAEPVHLGSIANSNERTINKYIHPDGVKSCQLVMSLTLLEPNKMWNTMPAHTHARRMEVYFYFDISGENVVFHLMGEPDEIRHLVVRNEQAVLSPSWSIHAGMGTGNYAFIWAMAGENQTLTDMDTVPMGRLL
jgi:4-deoxy-L-threo-5-hexosulose-uronate ketol-isomerase